MDSMHPLPWERGGSTPPQDHWTRDVDLSDYPHPTRTRNATPHEIEEIVEMIRLNLWNRCLPHGPQAIRKKLEETCLMAVPSQSKIARILNRRGLSDPDDYAPRHNSCPGPEATKAGDVHETGLLGPFRLEDGGNPSLYCLNSVDVATGRCAVEPVMTRGGQDMIDAIWATWDRLGIPHHIKVPNDPVFYGTSRHPRSMGKLIRLCLLNDVEPHFIPLGEAIQSPLLEDLHRRWLLWIENAADLSSMQAIRREARRFEMPQFPVSSPDPHLPLCLAKDPPDLGLCRRLVVEASSRFPATARPPRLPLPKPSAGRYHVVRYVGRDQIFDLFGEKISTPHAAMFTYVQATVDRGLQRLFFYLDRRLIGEADYRTS
jgi:putative transposase